MTSGTRMATTIAGTSARRASTSMGRASLSYDSSDYPDFSVADATGSELDEDSQFSAGENTLTISADNLQAGFPYAAEMEVRYDGYLNFFESHMVIVDNFTSHDFDFTFDVPGFVCDVDVYAKLYVKTSTWSNTELNNTYLMTWKGRAMGLMVTRSSQRLCTQR